jgi:hypothetical protein
VWEGALMQDCGAGISIAMGIIKFTDYLDIDEKTNCGIAIGATMAVAWVALVLSSDGYWYYMN